jgi:hypothetical protein
MLSCSMSLLVQLTHMMAAGWWFYDIFVTPDFLQKLFQQLLIPEGVHDRKAATIKIVETFFKDNSENMTRRPK